MYRKCETFALQCVCPPIEDSRSGLATLPGFCKPLFVPSVRPGYFGAGCKWRRSFPCVCRSPVPQEQLLTRCCASPWLSGDIRAAPHSKAASSRAGYSLLHPPELLVPVSALSWGDQADGRSCLRVGGDSPAGFLLQ